VLRSEIHTSSIALAGGSGAGEGTPTLGRQLEVIEASDPTHGGATWCQPPWVRVSTCWCVGCDWLQVEGTAYALLQFLHSVASTQAAKLYIASGEMVKVGWEKPLPPVL
jgi:hypothetical protein